MYMTARTVPFSEDRRPFSSWSRSTRMFLQPCINVKNTAGSKRGSMLIHYVPVPYAIIEQCWDVQPHHPCSSECHSILCYFSLKVSHFWNMTHPQKPGCWLECDSGCWIKNDLCLLCWAVPLFQKMLNENRFYGWTARKSSAFPYYCFISLCSLLDKVCAGLHALICILFFSL